MHRIVQNSKAESLDKSHEAEVILR